MATRSSARPRHRLGRQDQSGISLVEICLTIIIMGAVLVLLVGSMTTAETTSNLVAVRSQEESYARRLAEVVRSQIALQCDATSQTQAYKNALDTYLTGHGGAASNFSFTVPDVAFTTDPTKMDPSSAGTWSRGTCSGTTPTLEWVQIRVTSTAVPAAVATVAAVQRNTSAI